MRKKNFYEAQALAITMVVLVVSSIIGLSIYSRSLRDKELSLDERASAEALEISDLMIEKLAELPINTVLNAVTSLGKTIVYPNGVQLEQSSTLTEVSDLFNSPLIGYTGFIEGIGFCKPEEGNKYEISLKEADETSPYEVTAGQIWSLPLDDSTFTDCTLNLHISKGDSRSGFSVTKIYGKNYDESGLAGEYKEYETDDVSTYCFSDNGSSCNNTENFLDNWNKYTPSTALPIDLTETKDGYKLDEVTVKAIGGNIGVYYTMNMSNGNSCIEGFRMIELRAAAYCDGIYRGKDILIPQNEWHSSIFDYVLFNGEGSL